MPPLPAGIEFVPISALTFSSDRRDATLAFVGASPFAANDACSADYSAWTHFGSVLNVGVWESRRPPGAHACDAMGYGRKLKTKLERPFDGAIWRDVSAPYVHFLAAPSGLATIGLPGGWQLVDEGDVDESTTGRWSRVYATRPDAPPKQSLSIFQSFDGPVNVTGGAEVGSEKVGDRFATSYRHGPSGEIVLVWPWGAGELALVTNEHVISMPALVRIAGSAH